MAVTSFYLYPNATFDSFGSRISTPNYDNVNDGEPIASHDGIATFDYIWGWNSGDTTGGMTYSLTTCPPGLTVNKIRVYGAFFRSRAGDAFSNDPEVTVCCRPGGSSTYYTATCTYVSGTGTATSVHLKTLGTYNRNTASWGSGGTETPGCAYWEWATNPETSAAWSLADLNNLKVGWFFDDSKGSPTAGHKYPTEDAYRWVCCTSLYVWVEANTVAASIEGERAKGSQFLRMFRKPVRKMRMVVPVEYADLDVGDTFVVSHPQGPHPSGAGWGKKNWQRREMMLLSTSLNPATRQVELVALDVRDFACGLWSPLVTDIGFSEEGNGVPILHHGGGLTFDTTANQRSSTHYVQKQTNDLTASACGTGKGLWTPYGLWTGFPYALNVMYWSTFKDGSGTTFTSWTANGSGTIAEDTTNILIDADGFRRGPKLSTGSSQNKYMTQTSTTIGATNYVGRVRVHWTRTAAASSGDGKMYFRLYRSTGTYWNDTTKTWTTDTWNAMDAGTELGLQRFVSNQIDFGTSATYTLDVGIAGSSSGAAVTLNEASVLVATTLGNGCALAAQGEPILPTAGAWKYFEPDHAYFPLTTGNELREDRGTITLRWTPTFNHSDMSDAAYSNSKAIWTYSRNWGTEYMRADYYRSSSTAATIRFYRSVYVGITQTIYTASVALSGSNLATRGQEMSLGFRWTSASDELDLGVRQMKVYVIPASGGTMQTGTATYTDFTSYGISISDETGGSKLNGYSNSWVRGAAADGWTAGFGTYTSGQRITGAGALSFVPYTDRTLRDARVAVGFDPSPHSAATRDSINFCLEFECYGSTCRYLVVESGSVVATGGSNSWNSDEVYGGVLGKIVVESASTVKYYVGGTLTYTNSAAGISFPLYVDASAYDDSGYSQIRGVALYGSNLAGTFDQSACDPPRLELPCNPGHDPWGLRSATGGGTYKHLEVVPFVLTDEEVERRMR